MSYKKELIIFSYFLMGGSANLFRNLLGNIPSHSLNIKLILLKYDWKDQVAPLETDYAVNTVVISTKSADPYERYIQFKKNINNERGLIVCSDTGEFVALKFYKNLQKNICFICHEDSYIETAVKYENIIAVIIAHNYSVYLMLKLRLPNSNIHFIYHGVKVIEFNKTYNLTESLNLVFLARHTKVKGLYDLLAIDGILKNKNIVVNWTILGDGPERNNFILLAKDRLNFNFLIPKTNDEVIEVLKIQDILIHPSKSDGLPVAILEAMSVGCVPIVSQFNEGIKEVVVNDINGFVEKIDDIEGMANRIIYLHTNRHLLVSMSEANKLRVSQDFNIAVQAKKYFNIFEEYSMLPPRKIKTWNAAAYVYYRWSPLISKLSKYFPTPLVVYLKKYVT